MTLNRIITWHAALVLLIVSSCKTSQVMDNDSRLATITIGKLPDSTDREASSLVVKDQSGKETAYKLNAIAEVSLQPGPYSLSMTLIVDGAPYAKTVADHEFCGVVKSYLSPGANRIVMKLCELDSEGNPLEGIVDIGQAELNIDPHILRPKDNMKDEIPELDLEALQGKNRKFTFDELITAFHLAIYKVEQESNMETWNELKSILEDPSGIEVSGTLEKLSTSYITFAKRQVVEPIKLRNFLLTCYFTDKEQAESVSLVAHPGQQVTMKGVVSNVRVSTSDLSLSINDARCIY